MSNILKNLDGVVYMIDNVLIYGSTQEEHDQQLEIVLNKLHKARVTLNRSKCKFSKSSVRFLGQMLDSQGICVDPDYVKAIQQMKEPENAKELR